MGPPRRTPGSGRTIVPGRPIAILEPDGTLALTLWGSSSSPWVPVGLTVLGDNHIRVDVSLEGEPGWITLDYSPNTTATRLPDEIDIHRPVTVDIAFSHGSSTMAIAEQLTPDE